MASDVKWIKITTDIFDDEKILMIESMPSADSIIVIWLKLLTFAGKQNNDGVFLMSNRIAYTDEMLACIFRRDVNLVRLALKTFEQFGMIEIIEKVITIPNWGKHQTLDAYEKKKVRDRERIARKRAEQKALALMSPDMSPDKSPDVAFSEEDKEEEKDKDKEIDNKISSDLQSVVELNHSICVSYPKIRSLSDARKKTIKARLKSYNLDDFRTLFENAEASSFLKGSEGGWKASFDWLIKESNMLKVLEGNYTDKPKRYGYKEKVPGWMGFKAGDAEVESIHRALNDESLNKWAEENPIDNDPDFHAEAEQLRRELQESFGRN